MGLVNGRFGEPFVAHPQHDNILVAYGWQAWWDDRKWPEQDQDPKRLLKVGEYRPIDGRVYPYRVIEGDTCQAWFVQFGLMNGGIYQQVQVGAGLRVTFDLPFQTWCTNSGDPRVSDGELYLRVGIDERGGVDWEAESIVWGNWIRGRAEYASTSISTISQTDTVTLWVWTWNKWALPGHNDVYVDAATLEVEGAAPPPVPDNGVLRVELSGTVRIETPSLMEKFRAFFR